MKALKTIVLGVALATTILACSASTDSDTDAEIGDTAEDTSGEDAGDTEEEEESEPLRETRNQDPSSNDMCRNGIISRKAAEKMLRLTELTDRETIYSTYDRIDRIAALFEECGDPWGLFPTAYRHITRRIIKAIDSDEIPGEDWGRAIVLDFASRYFEALRQALSGEEPSYAWRQYYYLADREDVSRTRAVVVAMVAHLTYDLPYALVAIDSTEEDKNDYFVLGELMIEITPDFLQDLRDYYNTDAEDILNGFFFGNWVDGVYGPDTTITLSYQTIRTKSWNNRWLLQQWWGVPVAEGEIYTAFWAIDGVLASLDAAGTI